MNGNWEPENQFEQWTVDNMSHLQTQIGNHLKHHTKWTYGLVIAVIGLIGSLLLALLK